MISIQDGNFYDVLDIATDATSDEVRSAYFRAKATYNKDNVVLYSLMNREDRETILKNIEEAYLILSDPEKRREYDQYHGLVKVELLSPPLTPLSTPATLEASTTAPQKAPDEAPHEPPQQPQSTASSSIPPQTSDTQWIPNSPLRMRPRFPHMNPPQIDPALALAIQIETEWSGAFLKKIREAMEISLEEMSDTTKISKIYLSAIESETFEKLPAPVYTRGFLCQIARILRQPPDKVATAYMKRYQAGSNSC